MIPMKHSSIFKSRWMALIWAAGMIWFAVQVASPDDSSANATDATGAPITAADEQALKEALKGL